VLEVHSHGEPLRQASEGTEPTWMTLLPLHSSAETLEQLLSNIPQHTLETIRALRKSLSEQLPSMISPLTSFVTGNVKLWTPFHLTTVIGTSIFSMTIRVVLERHPLLSISLPPMGRGSPTAASSPIWAMPTMGSPTRYSISPDPSLGRVSPTMSTTSARS